MAGMARVRLDPRALSRVRGGCRGARQHHAAVPCSFPRAGGGGRKRLSRAADPPPPFSAGGIAGQIAENAADDVFFCGAGISCCPLPRRSRFVAFSCEGGNIILSAAGSMLVYFYARGPRLNNGKIGVFCTLGQKTSTFLARYSRNVPSDSVFSVRSVQNTLISPKWAAREYISVKSCQKAVLWLRWSTFGEDFATCPLSLGDCSLGQAVSGFVGHVSAFRSGFVCRIESRDCSHIGPRDCPRIGSRNRLSHSARNRSWHRPPGEGRPSHTGGSATRSQPRRPLRYNRSRKHA